MTHFTLFTSELSPFSIKAHACLAFLGHSYNNLPADGSKFSNGLLAAKLAWAKRRGTIAKYPEMTELDEYPGLPFFIEPNGKIQYDTSAFSRWLDSQPSTFTERKLWPEDPALGFVAQLIDEAMDEFALYLAHHLRWWHSAQSNTAGKRLHKEFSRLPLFSMLKNFPIGFSKRQVSRLPYLFSMPPAGTQQQVSNYLKAPIKAGWPETHGLLDQAWLDYTDALEALLQKQPYLLGAYFTIADASTYGIFGMLLDDPDAEQDLLKRTPTLHKWLLKIKNNEHVKDLSADDNRGGLCLTDDLLPLLNVIQNTFVPLMKQNEAAYQMHIERGETLFNEAAMAEGRALFQGELMERPFKAVTKSFQVQAWRDIQKSWTRLSGSQREGLCARVPGLSRLTEQGRPPVIF